MREFTIIKTSPGDSRYSVFESVPARLYEPASLRFKLGNDPVSTHLEACYVLLNDNKPVGRFAFYENPGLKFENEVAACIGSYECIDDEEASNKLIQQAKDLAKRKGYTWLIGPMEGSTWNNYRFSKHNDYANFFLEPFHHVYYNRQFISSGFREIADYYSNRDQLLAVDTAKLDELEKQWLKQGAVIRKIDMDDFRNEVMKIARLCLDGFASNLLYTPISIDAFVSKYEGLKKLFDPDLVWIVEDSAGEMQAFVFAIKDYLDSSNETIVVKSMARRPSSKFRGIGYFLAAKITRIARELGYKKVIHALMIKSNVSMDISETRAGDQYKSYALYGLKL